MLIYSLEIPFLTMNVPKGFILKENDKRLNDLLTRKPRINNHTELYEKLYTRIKGYSDSFGINGNHFKRVVCISDTVGKSRYPQIKEITKEVMGELNLTDIYDKEDIIDCYEYLNIDTINELMSRSLHDISIHIIYTHEDAMVRLIGLPVLDNLFGIII